MILKNKKVLILGLGISGISTAKALNHLGAKLAVSDAKSKEKLQEDMKQLKGIPIDYYLNNEDVPLEEIDLIIKSPGIPLNVPHIKKAEKLGIEVVTDIELAYRIGKQKIIGITGTNGKTTTTTLIGDLVKNGGYPCRVTGNIGVGILWEMVHASVESVFVVEASSFQLESTRFFRPNISLIINISPDHLNWHMGFENYVKAKKKIFINQNKDDFTILNYDDKLVRTMGQDVRSNLIYFSQETSLEQGVYISKDGYIIINDGISEKKILHTKDIKIPGKHNLENILAATAVAWAFGIDVESIGDSLKAFEGVEHRLEYVDCIDGIKFYNDSKGTNPNASIKAIEAIKEPIVLIAGGYDKGSNFDEFIESFNSKVHRLILLGETANQIETTAKKFGFDKIIKAQDMQGAVTAAYNVSKEGYNILLSPACASWDMYKSYEERGKDFKQSVCNLRGLNHDEAKSQ